MAAPVTVDTSDLSGVWVMVSTGSIFYQFTYFYVIQFTVGAGRGLGLHLGEGVVDGIFKKSITTNDYSPPQNTKINK